MVSVRLKNPSIILKPLTNDEVEEHNNGFSDLYVLYRNKEGGIEIGIPSMQRYFPATANMYGVDEAIEKAFFYCGSSKLKEQAPTITDRPVYEVYPTDNRQVAEFNILNSVEVDLAYVLDGSYTIGEFKKTK